jgi:hypothetical protein
MTIDFGGGDVRYEGDRPVAVGDLRLAQPTRMAATSAGFWGLYEAGDEGRDDADRETARSFLPFLGGDDPGAAADVPRSRVEQGPPPTYDLSDERNTF